MSIFDPKKIYWNSECAFRLFSIVQNTPGYKRYRLYGWRMVFLLIFIIVFVVLVVNRHWFGWEGNDEYWNFSGMVIVISLLACIIYAMIKRGKMSKMIGTIVFYPGEHFELVLNDTPVQKFMYNDISRVEFKTGFHSFAYNSTTSARHAPNSRIDIYLQNNIQLELLIQFDKTGKHKIKEPNNLYQVFELIRKKNHNLYTKLRETVEINYLNEKNYSSQ